MNDLTDDLTAALRSHPADDTITLAPIATIRAGAHRRRRTRRVAATALATAGLLVGGGPVLVTALDRAPTSVRATDASLVPAAALGHLGPGDLAGRSITQLDIRGGPATAVPGQWQALAVDRGTDGTSGRVVHLVISDGERSALPPGPTVELSGVVAERSFHPGGGTTLRWAVAPGRLAELTAVGLGEEELLATLATVAAGPDGSAALSLPAGMELVEEGPPTAGAYARLALADDRGSTEVLEVELSTATRSQWLAPARAAGAEPSQVGGRDVLEDRAGDAVYLTWWDRAAVAVTVRASGVAPEDLARVVSGVAPLGEEGWARLGEQAAPGSSAGGPATTVAPPAAAPPAEPQLSQLAVGAVLVDGAGTALVRPGDDDVRALSLVVNALAGACPVEPLDATARFSVDDPAFRNTCTGARYGYDGRCLDDACHLGLDAHRVEVLDGDRLEVRYDRPLHPQPRHP